MDTKRSNSKYSTTSMAYHSLSEDDDIEFDRAPLTNEQFVVQTSDIVQNSKHSTVNLGIEDLLESGYSSQDFHGQLKKVTQNQFICEEPEKTPIQCSEDNETEASVGDLVGDFDHLKLSAEKDDEGIYSLTTGSVCSENVSVPEDEIEVDLWDIDEDGDTLLHLAVIQHMYMVVLALIFKVKECDLLACLNIQNNLRQTPLHLAVLTDQPDVVRALVEAGADVTARDQQGNTPLHVACRKGSQDAVYTLVKSFGDDVDRRKEYFEIRNSQGLTCLHVASENKEYEIMGHLFARGADVNVTDGKSGRTALHYAVENKDLQTVTLLLTHADIDVDSRTFSGDTPVVIAFWRNYTDILKKLKTNGASFSYDMVEESDDEDWS
ncbi:NF-kappa-B inhibitor alpha-like [Mya arenaria]|uniref:NF-kappa-B inhibitor alpha-like n=1 Tax=Mya arenaria TaxID=6604 RepID=UPI0022E657AF|nr:NF-kappa-B inhibitor alpha-like [Mya arenaria]